MDLAQGVRAAVARGRQSGSYLGTVTAIDATALALTIDIGAGTPLTGVRWVGSYAPAVDDFVTVLRAGTSWVVLGKLSKNLTGPGFVDQSITVRPVAGTWGVVRERYWDEDAWGPWDVVTSEQEDLVQGAQLYYSNDGSGGEEYWYASGGDYGSAITSAIPSGATVTDARVRMARTQDYAASLVSPVLYGLTAAQATAISRNRQWPTLPAESGPWRPGTLAETEAGSWALPSAWLTNLLSGTWRSLMVMSSLPAEYARFDAATSLELVLTYRLPA